MLVLSASISRMISVLMLPFRRKKAGAVGQAPLYQTCLNALFGNGAQLWWGDHTHLEDFTGRPRRSNAAPGLPRHAPTVRGTLPLPAARASCLAMNPAPNSLIRHCEACAAGKTRQATAFSAWRGNPHEKRHSHAADRSERPQSTGTLPKRCKWQRSKPRCTNAKTKRLAQQPRSLPSPCNGSSVCSRPTATRGPHGPMQAAVLVDHFATKPRPRASPGPISPAVNRLTREGSPLRAHPLLLPQS